MVSEIQDGIWQLTDHINVFKSINCPFQFFPAKMAKTKQFSPAFHSSFCGNNDGESSSVNWGKNRRKKALKICHKDSACLKNAAILWMCEGRGPAAVTFQDPQFVSDLRALLSEIFNLGVLETPSERPLSPRDELPCCCRHSTLSPYHVFFLLFLQGKRCHEYVFRRGAQVGHEMAD